MRSILCINFFISLQEGRRIDRTLQVAEWVEKQLQEHPLEFRAMNLANLALEIMMDRREMEKLYHSTMAGKCPVALLVTVRRGSHLELVLLLKLKLERLLAGYSEIQEPTKCWKALDHSIVTIRRASHLDPVLELKLAHLLAGYSETREPTKYWKAPS